MDTHQSPPIATQPLKRKERSPSPARRTTSHTSTTGSRPSPTTSLPSIRHFLPPQADTQLNERYHPNRQQTGPAFPAGPSAGIPRLDYLPPPAQPPAERGGAMHSGGIIADSDGDGDSEQAARPKQKRRRQALSCTECKRRKIKCDRAHPCTPCIRRGDQNKCQWHVIEPVDKYVSRAEYDELKARVDRLETLLLPRAHLPSGFAPQPGPESSSPSSSQIQQQLSSTRLPGVAMASGQQGTAVAAATTSTASPAPMVPYSHSPPGPSQIQGPAAASAFPTGLAGPSSSSSRSVASAAGSSSKDYGGIAALRAPTSPVGRSTAMATTALLPPLASLAHGGGPAPFDGPLSRPSSRLLLAVPPAHRERERDREQQHQPYAPLPPPQPLLQQPLQPQPHQQAKNYRAQTLTPLGERLRLSIRLQGPAVVSRLYHRRRRTTNISTTTSSSGARLRRLRLLIMRGARRSSWSTTPACHSPLPLWHEPQRRGTPSVKSENGSRLCLSIIALDGL